MATIYNDMTNNADIQRELNEWTLPHVEKTQVAPQELAKITAGYAIEQHQWTDYHHFASMTSNPDIKRLFTQIGAQEEEHLAMMGSLTDPDTTPLEASLALEMTAVTGFTEAAQVEPNQTCKSVYDYILYDHLTQTKAIADIASQVGTNPQGVIKNHIEVRRGRPLDKQFVPTDDLMKPHLNKDGDDIMSFVNLHMLLAAEESLHNELQLFRRMLPSYVARRLYSMINAIETLHASMLESLDDPNATPLERAMINEMAEIRTHQLGAHMAKDANAKRAHEYALRQDEQHLSWLRDTYSNVEHKDSAKYAPNMQKLFAPPQMPANDYINQVMQTQVNIMPRGMGFEKAA
ncbi:MAG TPA: hypothetical protein VGK02_06775 [Candidatus Aquicultor sp.]